MHCALIAHDSKKLDLLHFIDQHLDFFKTLTLTGTGTTSRQINEKFPDLHVNPKASGPLGGDAQIGALIVEGKIDFVIFLIDPLFAHPHEPDIHSLLRLCMLYNIPIALNLQSAQLMISAIG